MCNGGELKAIWDDKNRLRSCGILDGVRFVFVAVATLLFTLSSFAETKIQGDFSHVGDTSHFELRGLKSWVYSVRRVETDGHTAIRLEVPHLEPETVRKLRATSSPLVQKIEWLEQESTIDKMVLLFHLVNPAVRTFDYQVEDPSQLIVDFYTDSQKQNKPTVAKSAPKKSSTELPAKVKTPGSEASGSMDAPKNIASKPVKFKEMRRPASDTPLLNESEKKGEPSSETAGLEMLTSLKSGKPGVLDGSDPEYLRFEVKPYQVRPEAIQLSKQNVYLPIPMLQMPYNEIDEIVGSQPVYQVLPGEGEENEQARFLLTLFERKRNAAFLKAYKVFKKKFPTSKYSELMEYIYADIHYREYKNTNSTTAMETALNTYSELMVRYPQSPMYDRTAILVANTYLQKGELVRALRSFQKYLNDRPESPHRDVIRLAMARSFAGVNQYDTATSVLQDLAKNAVKPKYAIEAQFRLGDAAFIQNKFEQAVENYQDTLKKHPTQVANFPNLYFNLAEAQFWLGRYPESLEAFRNQLKTHPTHNYSSYALTRLAELQDILGMDPSRSQAAFMESYFRYYPQTGAKIARVRLLTRRLKDMKQKEFATAMKEILAIAEKNEIPGMEEFVTLSLTDGLFNRGDFKDAIDRLIKYHQHHPTSLNLPVFRSRITRILVDDIKSTIDKGDFIGGLDLFERHSTVWLKGINRRDLRYYLARAYENGGVFGEAQNHYTALLKETQNDAKNPPKLDVFDEAPSLNQLHLRLARVLFEQGDFFKSVEHLKQITGEDHLKDNEKVERVEIASQVFQKTGLNNEAVQMLARLIDTWKGQPELVASPLLQKAQVLAAMDKYPEAIKNLEQLLKVQKDSGKVSKQDMVQALRHLGDWNVRIKKSNEAIQYYQQALNTFESESPMPDIRYHLGQIYLEQGNLRDAEQTWTKLDPATSRVWYQMAQEQMKQDKFKADYKKYIERIPAMSQATSASTGG